MIIREHDDLVVCTTVGPSVAGAVRRGRNVAHRSTMVCTGIKMQPSGIDSHLREQVEYITQFRLRCYGASFEGAKKSHVASSWSVYSLNQQDHAIEPSCAWNTERAQIAVNQAKDSAICGQQKIPY